MIEVWKTISTEPFYEVSDQGRVRNTKTGKILKPWHGGKDKLKMGINSKTYYIHRLVAEHFLPDFDKDREVLHIGDIYDNAKNNLKMGEKTVRKRDPKPESHKLSVPQQLAVLNIINTDLLMEYGVTPLDLGMALDQYGFEIRRK